MTLKILSYNIRFGGAGREAALAAAITARAPDLVVLQEATRPDVVQRLAAATGMKTWAATPRHSLGFMSKVEVQAHHWHRPPACRRAFLELVLSSGLRVFGVHLSAIHSNWTERRRVRELRALLAAIQAHQNGPHVLAGDFNTLAPGEQLDTSRRPRRLRALAWLSGRTIRWQTIQIMLDARYIDGFRLLHPTAAGFTFPTWDPHVRLDYVFVPTSAAPRLTACEVVDGPDGASGSDHFPL
ncbi:MAG TPA: endonuclease/exonuclease/phosphatase family protein, partial [Vicinamibacteria bacterium]|nr:endonuclease/exonuclease/phosphatase family protein [Vicinamibacteria bacterium]